MTSPAELQAQLAASRQGLPFLVYRDGSDNQQIVHLSADRDRLSVGRSEGAELSLSWDADVSRAHAELRQVGDVWTIVDDGLSRNGTWVNGERVSGRRRLGNGDRMRFGQTIVVFHDPSEERSITNADLDSAVTRISDAQRRVLIALARPYANGSQFATPARNTEIAEELSLSVHAVKTHLRALFAKFGLERLPQNAKRAQLVASALRSGEISERDLTSPA